MEIKYTKTIKEIKKIPLTNLIFLILLTLYEPIRMIMSIKIENPITKNIKSVKQELKGTCHHLNQFNLILPDWFDIKPNLPTGTNPDYNLKLKFDRF